MGSKSWILFVAFGLAALGAAAIVGISDNPPGLALVYVATVSLVLAVAHRWRRVKHFVWLLVGSLALFPVAALLHNLLYALGEVTKANPAIHGILEVTHVGFFLAAIFLSPAGVLVGALGSLLAWRHSRAAA